MELSGDPSGSRKWESYLITVPYWNEEGKDGFRVWRYRLVRLENQPAFGDGISRVGEDTPEYLGTETPRRDTVKTSRIIRNSAVGNKVKELHDHSCQICGMRLETPSGPYAECCHIRPLGKPHNGPDTLDNVLCLCPNHHALFDLHAIHIADNMTIVETGEGLGLAEGHVLSIAHIQYHRSLMDM